VKAIASAKLKNDRVDSQTLAHLSRCDLLPEVWMARHLRLILKRSAETIFRMNWPTSPLPTSRRAALE